MLAKPNELQWHGDPGHYEVYYLTLTDPRSGVGLWIRYTMVAPLARHGRGRDVRAVAAGDRPEGRAVADFRSQGDAADRSAGRTLRPV